MPGRIPRINPQFAHMSSYSVSALIRNDGTWNSTLIHDVLVPYDAMAILSLFPPSTNRQDRLGSVPQEQVDFPSSLLTNKLHNHSLATVRLI